MREYVADPTRSIGFARQINASAKDPYFSGGIKRGAPNRPNGYYRFQLAFK